jgi:hypothetical protein
LQNLKTSDYCRALGLKAKTRHAEVTTCYLFHLLLKEDQNGELLQTNLGLMMKRRNAPFTLIFLIT